LSDRPGFVAACTIKGMSFVAVRENIRRVGMLAALLSVGSGLSFADSLKLGSPAPPIRFMNWIKGDPVSSFQHGKVYVIDFFATWCEPCKKGMPHLTALAKKYDGKAIVIGVDVRETEHTDGALKTVADFVRGNAANMGYRVTMDDPVKNTVFNDWMTAAGKHLIPTAFVVDGNGNIAWIGHPMEGLDEAVAKAVGEAIAPKS
jgi:thiol-disulfide isomerase/thioredoxin